MHLLQAFQNAILTVRRYDLVFVGLSVCLLSQVGVLSKRL